MPRRILVVEDEETIAAAVAYGLTQEGYEVRVVGDGDRAFAEFTEFQPDLVLLDVMLPGTSGLDVCRRIRRTGDVPIVMLTAKDAEADIVAGLEVGADDYITKPFSLRVLIARVRSALRRSEAVVEDRVTKVGGLILDAERHLVTLDGEEIELRPKEFQLLEFLMQRVGRLVTRDVLLTELWGPVFYGDPKTLDVHIGRLRSKLVTDPSRPGLITTVRGFGYRLEDL